MVWKDGRRKAESKLRRSTSPCVSAHHGASVGERLRASPAVLASFARARPLNLTRSLRSGAGACTHCKTAQRERERESGAGLCNAPRCSDRRTTVPRGAPWHRPGDGRGVQQRGKRAHQTQVWTRPTDTHAWPPAAATAPGPGPVQTLREGPRPGRATWSLQAGPLRWRALSSRAGLSTAITCPHARHSSPFLQTSRAIHSPGGAQAS